ncbi:MAG: hypothetical protein LUF81_01100, partial [Clostridiales bacterium]|nr:hypothetical protein [Clostridiales bacterium]
FNRYGFFRCSTSFYNRPTRNNGIIMEFLYLGNAIGIVTQFNKKYKNAAYIHTLPTLSPNDPNFPEWWKEHKSEWEDRKR